MPVASRDAIRELFDVVGPWREGYNLAGCVAYPPEAEFGCTFTLDGEFAFSMIVIGDGSGHWYVDSLSFGD